jgi:hypothetical protein
MSVRRAEDAGVSPWWVVAFFLPGLNYTSRMSPAPYWNMIADRILHDIHKRVLAHIKGTAERHAVR